MAGEGFPKVWEKGCRRGARTGAASAAARRWSCRCHAFFPLRTHGRRKCRSKLPPSSSRYAPTVKEMLHFGRVAPLSPRRELQIRRKYRSALLPVRRKLRGGFGAGLRQRKGKLTPERCAPRSRPFGVFPPAGPTRICLRRPEAWDSVLLRPGLPEGTIGKIL